MGSGSAKPESLGLTEREEEIYSIVLHSWPCSALEIAGHFNEDTSSRELKKKASTKYTYYLQKLVGKQLVLSKRIGNALVVWPRDVEKYKTIHDILEERELPFQRSGVDA